MKATVLIVVILTLSAALLAGCGEEVSIEPEHKAPEIQTYVVAGDATEDAAGRAFSIQVMESRYDPETLYAHQGDIIEIIVTNTANSDIERFSVQHYAAEQPIQSGNTEYVSFKADEKGLFLFGDESGRSGTLTIR